MENGRLSLQIHKAIAALKKHDEKTGKLTDETGPEPVEDREASAVYLAVGFTKMAEKTSLKPVRLAIPYPFRRATDKDISVCLFTKDPQRIYKDMINPLGIRAVSKIQGISKLRAKFKPFEAKRNLCGAFDLFLADARITPLLPKLLGKTFISKKKQPVPVRLEDTSLEKIKEELCEAIEATYFFKTGGSNVSIKAGKLTQDIQHLASNIEAIIKLLSAKLPEGAKSIRSIHLKTRTSVALPIFIRKAASASVEE